MDTFPVGDAFDVQDSPAPIDPSIIAEAVLAYRCDDDIDHRHQHMIEMVALGATNISVMMDVLSAKADEIVNRSDTI